MLNFSMIVLLVYICCPLMELTIDVSNNSNSYDNFQPDPNM